MRVRLIVHGRQLLNTRLGVALRGGKRRVPQQLLNGAEIGAVGQEVSRKCVAERVRVEVPVHIGEPRIFPDDRVNRTGGEPPCSRIQK